MRLLLVLAALSFSATAYADEFREAQLKIGRVAKAMKAKGPIVKAAFLEKKLAWPPRGVFLRAFKQDKVLELWGKKGDGTWELVKSYAICSQSGELGPKRREGDMQVPEGFYAMNHFNPLSNYHLSLGVSYPNASDRILSDKKKPGGAIYIHGDCVTIGCIPIEDDPVEEVYLAAMEARAAGQGEIPIHVFPTRLTEEALKKLGEDQPEHLEFWTNLKEGYDLFEASKKLPRVVVEKTGKYRFGAK